MSYYKVLDANRRSCHGGSQVWTPGEWVWVDGPVVPCNNGIHFCDETNLLGWIGVTIWEFEPAGETAWVPVNKQDKYTKLVAQGGRITRQVEAWNERTQRLFACDCAERVVHLCGDDPRPRAAINVARRYARGEASRGELAVAMNTAWAAWNTAWNTAWAAWSAAWDAAWAARNAAWCAVGDAAGDVAAWSAARDAAWAARNAAWAARAAEREWQSARLMQYLRGEVR